MVAKDGRYTRPLVSLKLLARERGGKHKANEKGCMEAKHRQQQQQAAAVCVGSSFGFPALHSRLREGTDGEHNEYGRMLATGRATAVDLARLGSLLTWSGAVFDHKMSRKSRRMDTTFTIAQTRHDSLLSINSFQSPLALRATSPKTCCRKNSPPLPVG